MLSRSNYFVITSIMIIILVLFQFTGVSEDVVLRNAENVNIDNTYSDIQKDELRSLYEKVYEGLTKQGNESQVGLVGYEDEPYIKAGREWCINQKKTYCIYTALEEVLSQEKIPDFLIIDGSSLSTEKDGELIKELGESDKTIVISGLPQISVLEKEKSIRDCLGIKTIKENVLKISKIKIFSGFLLGGETNYDGIELNVPYVSLTESVKVFAVGQFNDNDSSAVENEDLPPIIWRNYNNNGMVYTVNCDFLESRIGAGILTAISSDCNSEYLYPIVNAQISVLENYPLLSDENEDLMNSIYGHDSVSVMRDIVWPVVAGIYYDTNEKMTAVCSPIFDYSGDKKTDDSLLEYYYQQITKMSGEIGISGWQKSSVSIEEKLKKDFEIYDLILPNYQFNTFYEGELDKEDYEYLFLDGELLEDINTVLVSYEDKSDNNIFEYGQNDIIRMMMYMDNAVHDDEDDLRLRCMQTAYGYYATEIDMSKVIYPESEEDYWNKLSENWSKFYRPYRIIFDYFDKMTVAEADTRIRNYMSLEYGYERNGNTVSLKVNSYSLPCYFILCLNGEDISDIEGATAQMIENDRYILTVSKPTVNIKLEQSEEANYY